MLLSAKEIRDRLKTGSLIIEPFREQSLQPASYDLTIKDGICIPSKAMRLVSSLERVEMPPDAAGILRTRSSYARKGLLLGGGIVDPGFRGNLTLCLTNMSDEEIRLDHGERIVQMLFLLVKSPAETYEGKYQDSKGVVRSR
ncbi:MAG: dCTP deaminase [Methanocellales archaeon]|nr:dCTP deaminase [Methanocellales archaeon]MDD3291009.1 dCTP deaminase [Methanocellales archaeon]MDD5234894.1 dCTP deaminase [Methanocellales archaeon]MDD5484736.1 dCTP deaminase [Methanocellales archaeon]